MQDRYLTRYETILSDVGEKQWNRLNQRNNPFLSYEFLEGIERYNCVGGDSGWQPCHITLWKNDILVGALPLYSKLHSWGEFVFNFAWADAYAQHGLAYYPKLVSAIPFTPVVGQRFLCAEDDHAETISIKQQLIESAIGYAKESNYSSWHCLFPEDPGFSNELKTKNSLILERWGYQFHWQNQHYQHFDDFLASMTSSKRKKIRRERRRVKEQGITLQTLTGHEISDQQWQVFYQYYLSTFSKKNNYPAFTLEFFQNLGTTLPDQVLLILAQYDGHNVAGAFFMRNATHLYGRHWGCLAEFHSLHFELCYYAAIEYCIVNGIDYFDAGAQGEHKISRGFLPVKTRSLHWIAHEGFHHAIDDFLCQERHGVSNYIEHVKTHSPFKNKGTS
ncbi:MAG: GNAT family N-acetyltransferase [Gammaproteobacteria bacterium]|nr:GNAT family N-acetyltransferase [Gammaproteobacteria bacterium]